MTVSAYEADPKKVSKKDSYLARSPHYGRYAPHPDDFTPEYDDWYSSERDAIPYWTQILEQFCTSENALNEPGTRIAFAVGKVIVRIDQSEATGSAVEQYSYLNANELRAARKAEEVLKNLGVAVPKILFCGTIDGKNVTVETRIPGVSLEVAWRYLPAKEKQNFKLQCRQLLQRLATVDPSADLPSYICHELNTITQPQVPEVEREILFADKDDGEDFCLVHNDMTRANIIVDNGRIVGLLGWRQCGFFGHDRARRVHSFVRVPERSYIPAPSEKSADEQAWADLYDFQSESAIDYTGPNGTENEGAKVKTEPSTTSLEKVPLSSTQSTHPAHISPLDGAELPDEHPTPKKITDLKRGSISRASSSDRSSPSAPSKLGPNARSSSSASTKKGTAAKKPGPKKRKIDALDADSLDDRRSNTPTSSRASKGPPAKRRESTSVAGSPAPEPKKRGKKGRKSIKNGLTEEGAAEEESDVENPDELFCVCRKPDNHTWMIGCDGGCEDWFHGKCVNMDRKDSELIDKYICKHSPRGNYRVLLNTDSVIGGPNCHEAGKGRTTWKPMCRLKECRKPARLKMDNLSKYCSDEHGREFMHRMTQHLTKHLPIKTASLDPLDRVRGVAGKNHSRDSHSVDGDAESIMETDEEEDHNGSRPPDDLGSRGGLLTAGDLKAVVQGVHSAREFRQLGDHLVSPPPLRPSVKSEGRNDEEKENSNKMGLDLHPPNLVYSVEEETKLQKLRKKRHDLLHRREVLQARNKFVGLVRQRSKTVLDRLKQKEPKGGWKDICGFDGRLAWNDDEFDEWRQSEEGTKAFQEDKLEPERMPTGDTTDADGDEKMADDDEDDDNDKDHEFEEFARGVCMKKRCERHKQWNKMHQQEIQFEEGMLKQDLKHCEDEAAAVVERAVLRMWTES
jgi:COMPASS component SPP1